MRLCLLQLLLVSARFSGGRNGDRGREDNRPQELLAHAFIAGGTCRSIGTS